jgi:hypothetical protein
MRRSLQWLAQPRPLQYATLLEGVFFSGVAEIGFYQG